ncbi:hypothetical protein CQ018_11595 [Arthrobacter sp. MYb227]|uniref:YqeB family protein n=1 Tax=Arthrobacter sp. MYb227 TaxID=1848601 RepID=UPI000CFB47C8|nr:hypothetical protein [Arthrobacter sp. MYb227]PQZ92161.1 hypothetical protein CQ018_11595 [Arthrobacter sp. MYb227]
MASVSKVRIRTGILLTLVLLCTGLGVGAGFVVGPVSDWLNSLFGGTPAVLRLVLELPSWAAIGILGIVGLLFGLWLADETQKETLEVEVSLDGVVLKQYEAKQFVARRDIAVMFLDGKELVALDVRGHQLSRHKANDLSRTALERALLGAGYPYEVSGDRRATDFIEWVDGHPKLTAEEHALMRSRVAALRDKDSLAAFEATQELTSRGVLVREQRKIQQIRRARP